MTRCAPCLVLILVALVAAACGGAGASAAATSAVSEPPTETPPPSTTQSEASSAAEPSQPASQAPASETPGENELDWTLAPNFGSTELTSGFTPDPFEQAVTSGGPIDASYLGGDCRGFATAAPDFDVTYEAGSLTLLRFYFVADAADDTTLIINAPDGSWYCNDDAPGTIDPMFDFTNPESGLYDVWVGSYEPGTSVEGGLYVTELQSNAP
jgi:hypothetical protein